MADVIMHAVTIEALVALVISAGGAVTIVSVHVLRWLRIRSPSRRIDGSVTNVSPLVLSAHPRVDTQVFFFLLFPPSLFCSSQ